MTKKYEMYGAAGIQGTTYYILSLMLIVVVTIYLAVFSGLCQKLTNGCVPIDSTLGQLGISGIGITIGMMFTIAFTFIKPMLCNWPRGIGTIILLILVSTLLIICASINMKIYNKKFDDNGKEIDFKSKLLSIFMNSVLFIAIAIGIIFAILINIMTLSVGFKPILILGITLLPIALFSIVMGAMVLSAYNKNKNESGVCDTHPIDENLDLSGIANIMGTAKNPPYSGVLAMTIGSGIFMVLMAITLYFTKGKI